MNWYYESGGQQQGPVPDSELDRLLAEGKITLDTLVWREGLSGWSPLRTARPALPAGGAPVPGAPPVPAAADAGAPPPGYIRCTLTGKYFPPSEIIYIEGKPYSAEAKPQVMQSLQAGAALPGGDFERNGPPWEQRQVLGMWKAMIETIKGVLIEPTRTFTLMKRDGGLGNPLTYLLLAGGGGLALGYLYSAVLNGIMIAFAGSANNAGANPLMQMGMGAGFTVGMMLVMIIVAPAIAVVGAFIWGGLAHLGLMMFKGANRPFETTMRVTCYSLGSGWALHAIPICGSTVGLIWAIVCMCIGLGKAHDTTTGKGVAGALTPFIVCCVGGVIFYGLIIAMVVSTSSHH